MAEELEKSGPGGGEANPTPAGKPPNNMKIIIIGGGVFVVFLVIFLVMGGAFAPAPHPQVAESVEEIHPDDSSEEVVDDSEDFTGGNWNSEYSELSLEDEEGEGGGDVADSGMSAEDSVKQVLWYEAQRQEIDKQRTALRAEAAQLQQLKMETQALLERRQQIEQNNIANLAKLFETMKAEEVAKIMESIPNVKVGLILQKMKKQMASKVMASLPSERAAKITMELIDLGGEY